MSAIILRRAIITSSVSRHYLLNHRSSSSSSSSAPWLSTPGNPLMRWPSPPPQIPPHQIIPTDHREAPVSPPTDQDAADAATVAHLLHNTDPANLDSALLRSGIAPRSSLLDALLLRPNSDHHHHHHHPIALLTLARWARPHLTPSLLASLVDLLAKSRAFDSAWFLLLDSPSPAPLDTFAVLFRRYARAGMAHSAARTFHYILRHPESVACDAADDPFDLLVDALCKEGHTPAASELIIERRREAAPQGWTPSARCYNMLLHGWFRSRKLRKAERLWVEMQREGVRPTVVTYGTLIEGLCRMRRPDQAASLLDEMRAARVEPNSLTCNPIIDSLAEDGRFKDALNMLEKLPLYGVSPNISTYNSLVKGFCKSGDLVGASKILKTMIGRGILPTATTYNYFFRFFSKSGKIEEGMNLYTKMIQSGYTPDRLTYELLIKMLCEKERLDLAVQLIREMNRNGFDSDLDTSTMMVHLLCRMRKFDEACAEFKSMIKRGIVPQYITYRMLVNEFKRLGMLDMERKVSELMDSVPHSTKLPGTYRERVGDEAVQLRKTIMKKAQVMSEALKACKVPKKVNKLSSLESTVESADRLISEIKRRVYAVKS